MTEFFNHLKASVDFDDKDRKNAWSVLESFGFPTRKWDAFKYVSLNKLDGMDYGQIHDEVYSSHDSQISLDYKQAEKEYSGLIKKSYSMLLSKETNPFVLLNAALYKAGRFIYIAPRRNEEVDFEFEPNGGMRMPKIEIYVGKDACCTLKIKLNGIGKYFFNSLLNVTIEEGGQLIIKEHYENSVDAIVMNSIRGTIKTNGKVFLESFSTGGRCERHDIAFNLAGEGSFVDLKGLSLPKDIKEIHHFITINHLVENTSSSQHYKSAIMDYANASFEGKIYVEKKAQKTSAYQLNNNLLLSTKAKARSKPNLEIYADDVKASHGATMSKVDKDALFYLRSRGLSINSAKKELTRGFCKELFNVENIDKYLSLDIK